MRGSALATLCAALLIAAPCASQTRDKSTGLTPSREIGVGVGHGIGFLPLFIAQDLGLLDKHARANGLNGKVRVRRFSAATPMRQALASGEIVAGAYGLTAFLLARDAARRTPKELQAVSGITTLPLVLVTARPDIRSLSDLKRSDKIAVPMLTAPQVTYLRMGASASSGGADRLGGQLVAMPHQESLDALTAADGVAAYFSSPPFTQIALKEPKVRAVTSSTEIMGGKTSFLVMASPKAALAAHPKLSDVLSKAIDEASGVIRKDPRRAAMVWLRWEPSNTLDARTVEAVLRELGDDFSSSVFGIERAAAYLRRDNRLSEPITNWKDVVAPAIAAGEGS